MAGIFMDGLRMGFGLMRLPRLGGGTEMTDPIDVEQCAEMTDMFMEAGGVYFDTAYIYPGSEEAARKFLVERKPRESYQLATKLNAMIMCNNAEEARKQFYTSLERTGAGYFDFYLLHSMAASKYDRYNEYGCWDFVKGLKAEGKIRHWGFSFHDKPEFLDRVLTDHPDAEFVQLQINYADWEDVVVRSRECYEVAVKHGKPVIVMEPVKGGTLANLPDSIKKIFDEIDPSATAASWALRFAASLPGVGMVLNGASSVEQMRQNLAVMKDFRPLNDAEKNAVEKAREVFAKMDRISCTACGYCMSGCPKKIRIPDIFWVMNHYLTYGELDRAKADYKWRPGPVRASECIKCGQCEGVCPQHLPIIKDLERCVDTLE